MAERAIEKAGPIRILDIPPHAKQSKMNARDTRRILNDEGNVLATSEYSEGVLDGVSRVYSPGGARVQEMHSMAGRLHGPYRTWWETGLLKEAGEFADGQRIGEYYWYNEDGTLWQSHTYLAPN